MLRNNKRKFLGILALCAVFGVCAARPEAKDETVSNDTPKQGMTIQKGDNSESLYFEALSQAQSSEKQSRYTKVYRGDYIESVTIAGEVVYPKQERIRYDFSYGNTFFLEAQGADKPIKKKGDVIAKIFVQFDQIELAALQRQIQRMEERGETGTAYDELKDTLKEMQDAVTKTEIVMEQDGYLLEQDFPRFGSNITSYHIVVADLDERLISVPNDNLQFRYGQQVQVSAKVDGVTKTGTGRVITASSTTVSAELAGTKALIRLDEESDFLYGGSGISVTVETVHMEDVLLLDVKASYLENGMQMVKVKDEYGLHAVGFTFGRKNFNTYWVIDGLEEGTEILIQ